MEFFFIIIAFSWKYCQEHVTIECTIVTCLTLCPLQSPSYCSVHICRGCSLTLHHAAPLQPAVCGLLCNVMFVGSYDAKFPWLTDPCFMKQSSYLASDRRRGGAGVDCGGLTSPSPHLHLPPSPPHSAILYYFVLEQQSSDWYLAKSRHSYVDFTHCFVSHMFYHYGIHEAKYHLSKTHLLISTADVIEESFSLVEIQSKIT